MGAGACCMQKRLDTSVDWIGDAFPVVSPDDNSPCSFAPRAADVVVGLKDHDVLDDFAEEVSFQIANDRQPQVEAASWLPANYEIRPPEPDDIPPVSLAVHRKTRVPRQLRSFRKPFGVAAQERLHSCIFSLQRLSEEPIAKVFEVFEDYVNIHVVQELCTGGSVYERILERQYFTEQETAVLVKHMLQALVPLHTNHMYHGSLNPECFRFLNSSPHSPLKLVDFGLELKAHRWDAVEHVGGPDLHNPSLPHFFETCKLVFVAPEFAPPQQPRRKKDSSSASDIFSEPSSAWMPESDPGSVDRSLLDEELLANVLTEHADWLEEQRFALASSSGYWTKNQAADIWSIGAMAFLLLCGYPPFFAPSRNAILARIHRGEVAFDPPFWSKISEDAKSFVSGCLQHSFWDRFNIQDALNHPWILRLADNSPSGSMFASFMLNLRRFYRTSLIEIYTASILVKKFRQEDLQEFMCRCREIDMSGNGFFTASDLKHVLTALGHPSIAETISTRFLQTFRHPGESYIDYMALLDSVHLQQQRSFEDELWRHFQRVLQSNGRCGVDGVCSFLSLDDLGIVFGDPVIVGLLMREIPDSPALEDATVCHRLLEAVKAECTTRGSQQLDFRCLCSLILRQLKSLWRHWNCLVYHVKDSSLFIVLVTSTNSGMEIYQDDLQL